MLYYSTKDKSQHASFRDAVLTGLAPDGGLWMPSELLPLPDRWIEALPHLSLVEIAKEVAGIFAGEEVPPSVLRKIVNEALNFAAPLVPLDDDLFVLELFHGPTLAFKDFGARFLARLLSFFLEHSNRKVTVLAATSGDTGSAVASGFYGVKNIRVYLLYPSGKVSAIQEKQMTTWGKNITALEVTGNFDDCQAMVKQAFQDAEIRKKVNLTSANSINIGRLIPQCFYYFHAFAQLARCGEKAVAAQVIVSVPSGNLGNLTSGLFARRIGLPVRKFLASTNINDVFLQYLSSGAFHPRPSRSTISNSMDVGNPSNFARILALYNSDATQMRADIQAASFNDDQTLAAMEEVNRKYNYVCDPHTAVAYLGLRNVKRSLPGVFLATAHPAKFPDIVRRACGVEVEMPQGLRDCLEKEKRAIRISSNYADLKKILL